jgi:hypothetical protein
MLRRAGEAKSIETDMCTTDKRHVYNGLCINAAIDIQSEYNRDDGYV